MSETRTTGRFVVQRHQARTLHYDFRLEKDGVFKSWAVPKGLPEEPGVQRLALATDDHDLAFGDFQGQIPAGEPGAGAVELWDRGTYTVHDWTDSFVSVTLAGSRYVGGYSLVRFERGGARAWLISKNRGG
jgi:DNA ligase D-like protein (predicted 3'-phosphoesterase)